MEIVEALPDDAKISDTREEVEPLVIHMKSRNLTKPHSKTDFRVRSIKL